MVCPKVNLTLEQIVYFYLSWRKILTYLQKIPPTKDDFFETCAACCKKNNIFFLFSNMLVWDCAAESS